MEVESLNGQKIIFILLLCWHTHLLEIYNSKTVYIQKKYAFGALYITIFWQIFYNLNINLFCKVQMFLQIL